MLLGGGVVVSWVVAEVRGEGRRGGGTYWAPFCVENVFGWERAWKAKNERHRRGGE